MVSNSPQDSYLDFFVQSIPKLLEDLGILPEAF